MSWDLPFEEVPDGPVYIDITSYMADQIVVRGGVITTAVGKLPCLVFDFSSSIGMSIPSITFVGETDNIQAVRAMVSAAAKSAIKESKR